MIINDAGLREHNDHVNEFSIVINGDLTRSDEIEYLRQLCEFEYVQLMWTPRG